jgi:hypothetical protein
MHGQAFALSRSLARWDDMANLIHVAIWQPQWRIKPRLEKDVDAGPKGGHEGQERL